MKFHLLVQAARSHSDQIADVLAVGSTAGYAGTLLAQVDTVVSIIAGILVALSAALSIYLHIKRLRQERTKKK